MKRAFDIRTFPNFAVGRLLDRGASPRIAQLINNLDFKADDEEIIMAPEGLRAYNALFSFYQRNNPDAVFIQYQSTVEPALRPAYQRLGELVGLGSEARSELNIKKDDLEIAERAFARGTILDYSQAARDEKDRKRGLAIDDKITIRFSMKNRDVEAVQGANALWILGMKPLLAIS